MHYLVTGGAGFIGSHISRELLARGHEVTIFDDLSAGKKENIPDTGRECHFVEGSITNLDLLREILPDIDGVFHEAAIVSVPWSMQHPWETAKVNIIGTMNVLLAARDTGVKKVVFASSSAIYGDNPELPKKETMSPDPKSPYALSKISGEGIGNLFCETYGLSFTGLRYFNVYGPGQDPTSPYAAVIPKFIRRLLNGEPPIIFGDGSQTRDFIYIRDVVEANIRTMERNGHGIYNVATGIPVSVNVLAKMIPDMMNISTTPLYEPERPGDILHSYADITQLKQDLFEPNYALEKGLAETIRYYRAHQD